MRLAKQTGDIRTLGIGLSNAAGCLIKKNEAKKAEDHLEEAFEIFRNLDEKDMLASVHIQMGRVFWMEEKWTDWIPLVPVSTHSWIKDFLIERNNLGNKGLVYFNILGLNLTNMDLECFGENRSRDLTIYNRFFRTALKGGAKYFFAEYDEIVVRNIYPVGSKRRSRVR